MSEQENSGVFPVGQPERKPQEPEYIDQSLENELLIAVLPRLETAGVSEPGSFRLSDKKRHTYDWRFKRYEPENTAGVYAHDVDTVMAQMTKKWGSEAMAIRYLLRGPNGRFLKQTPRINKSGVSWLESLGYTVVLRTLLVDIDTPGHLDWTPEDQIAFDRLEQNRPESLQDAGMYTTGRGWRIVQPMSHDVPIDQAEDHIRSYMLQLERDGIQVDWACKDWTHVFRMPRTFRPKKDKRYDADFLVRP